MAIFKFKRLIRQLSSETIGLTFPKFCTLSIPWLKIGNHVNMEITSNDDTEEIVIIIKQFKEDEEISEE